MPDTFSSKRLAENRQREEPVCVQGSDCSNPDCGAPVVLCLNGAASASGAGTAESPAHVPQSSGPSPEPPALGAIAAYQGLIVERDDFPDVLGESTRLRELIPQKSANLWIAIASREHRRLHATGRFADIQAEATRTPDGQVALVFRITPNYFVGEIYVTGNRHASDRRSSRERIEVSTWGSCSSRTSRPRLSNIKRLMEENGYYRSTSPTRSSPSRDAADRHSCSTSPRPPGRVGRLRDRRSGYSQGQIQDIAKMHPGGLVTVQRVSRALDRLRKKYQKQNRCLPRFRSPEVLPRKRNAVDYTFDIIPDPRWRLRGRVQDQPRRYSSKNVPVFEENAVDDDLLNEGRRNLLNYLQSRRLLRCQSGMQREPAARQRTANHL